MMRADHRRLPFSISVDKNAAYPDAYKHFDARDKGWTKVVLKPGAAQSTGLARQRLERNSRRGGLKAIQAGREPPKQFAPLKKRQEYRRGFGLKI